MRLRHLREEIDPGRLVPHLTAGFISGVSAMVVSISFAALISSGPLAYRVGNGIGLTLFGATLISAIIAL
jgi:hypothetical protein